MKSLNAGKNKEFVIQVIYSIVGNIIYCLGFNLLIVPMKLYSAGFMGMAQLADLLFRQGLHLPIPTTLNLTGIIYFVMNVPLMYMDIKFSEKNLL